MLIGQLLVGVKMAKVYPSVTVQIPDFSDMDLDTFIFETDTSSTWIVQI